MTSSAINKLKLKSYDENRYGKIVHSGHLNKKSKGKVWMKRFVVLWEDMALRFYETEARENVIGKIKLKNVSEIKKLSILQSKELDLENPYFFSIVSNSLKKSWQFGCDDDESLSQWVHILQSALTVKNKSNQQQQHGQQQQQSPPAQATAITATNKYIGHHGRNMSNMEDFSVAHSMSSRVSSIQSLSALSILSANGGIDEENDDDYHHEYDINEENDIYMTRKKKHTSLINEAINEEEERDDYDEEILNVEKTLHAENQNIVHEGALERKTNQKVLGKHLWETRYFKLSTHSLSIYTNNKTNIAESVIKLSSIISVNRSTKRDGTDLKSNRFDINIKDKTLHLRTENEMACQQWIHCLSLEKKKHRKSIRNNLELLEATKTLKMRRFDEENEDDDDVEQDDDNNDDQREQPQKQQKQEQHTNHDQNTRNRKESLRRKGSVRRFRRSRTSRYKDDREQDEEQQTNQDGDGGDGHDEQNDDDDKADDHKQKEQGHDKPNSHNSHSRNLSMKSWGNLVEKRHKDSISYDLDQIIKKKKKKKKVKQYDTCTIRQTESFQGFLIRKIGHQNDKIGEKLYFRLSDDTLEFSKIEENVPSNTENLDQYHQLHSSNILGTVSVEHIKSVNMVSNENDDEFIIVFNENDSSTDWILKTERNNKEDATKWLQTLQKAQKDAKDIANTINKINNEDGNHQDEDDEDHSEDSDDEEDDDEDSGNRTTTKRKKKQIGGSIKALQKMINDETIEELEMARNHELGSSKNLDTGFEINNLQNSNPSNSNNKNQNNGNNINSGFCSCLCFK